MTADATLTHELDSLHEKLAGWHRKRRSQPADRPATEQADRRQQTAKEHGLHGEVLEFIKLIAAYVEEAKESAAAHPSGSVLGAMVIGILIGRFLGRH